jgi:hypothetical protein
MYPHFFSGCNETWFLSTVFQNNIQMLNFIKIRPVEADLFHAEGRTDLMKQVVAFHCFTKAPKQEQIQLYCKYLL